MWNSLLSCEQGTPTVATPTIHPTSTHFLAFLSTISITRSSFHFLSSLQMAVEHFRHTQIRRKTENTCWIPVLLAWWSSIKQNVNCLTLGWSRCITRASTTKGDLCEPDPVWCGAYVTTERCDEDGDDGMWRSRLSIHQVISNRGKK